MRDIQIEFEKLCPEREGDESRKYGCPHWCSCKGTGYVETDAGEALLTFLRRHNFVQAREN